MNYRSIFHATIQTSALFVAGFIIPFLGQLLALFTPIPLILVHVREGWKEGAITLAASAIIMALLGGWQTAAVLVLSFGLMAIGTSIGMGRNMRPEQASLLGGLMPVSVVVAIVLFYISRTGKDPFLAIDVYLRESITTAVKAYTDLGLTEVAAMISSVPDSFIHHLARLLPGIMIATSIMQAASCYGIVRIILARRSDASAIPSEPLSLWHAPDAWVWGLIVTLALIILPNSTAKFTGWNLAIIFAVVYLTQGVAIIEHYFRKVRIKAFTRGLMHTLILAMPSIVFVIALGIVDIWADFRKVRGPVKAEL